MPHITEVWPAFTTALRELDEAKASRNLAQASFDAAQANLNSAMEDVAAKQAIAVEASNVVNAAMAEAIG